MTAELPRNVLLTGGSRGIGAAIAARLRAAGHTVHTPLRRELDLSSSESIERFLREHGEDRIDVLVNNAGINVLRSISDIEAATWHSMLQVNLTASQIGRAHV